MKPMLVAQILIAASLVSQAPVALAASTWNLTGSGCSSGSGLGNTRTCSGGVSVTAWSTTSGSSGSSNYSAAEVMGYAGGLGVRNSAESGASPDHSMDNATPGRDMLLLSFGSAVSLNQLNLGWVSGDSDLSVLAYTGSGSGAGSVLGKSAGDLLGSGGWSLVGQVAGGSSSGVRSFNSAGAFTSSWWLVSAYNSNFGGTSLGSTADYVKLLSVAGNLVSPPPSGQTPEPASLALVGLGALGIWGSARRRQRKAAAA